MLHYCAARESMSLHSVQQSSDFCALGAEFTTEPHLSTDEDVSTIGLRAYAIRRALGPDARRELSTRAMAEKLNATAAELGIDARYDSSVVTRIETGQRKQVTLDDVAVYAAVDPKRRGREWMGWGPASAMRLSSLPVVEDIPTTAAEVAATSRDAGRARRKGGHRGA